MYADVLLPIPVADYYTYGIPAEMSGMVKTGARVIVPFGSRRWFTGIIISLHDNPPEGIRNIREMEHVVDRQPVFLEPQLSFWKWIADYYLCSPGDVYKAAVPAKLRPEGDSAEEIKKLTAPKGEIYIRLSAGYSVSDSSILIDQARKAPRQQKLLKEFFRLLSRAGEECPGIRKADLIKAVGL